MKKKSILWIVLGLCVLVAVAAIVIITFKGRSSETAGQNQCSQSGVSELSSQSSSEITSDETKSSPLPDSSIPAESSSISEAVGAIGPTSKPQTQSDVKITVQNYGKSYMLTAEESSQFLKLYKNVKMTQIFSSGTGTGNNAGAGQGICEVTLDYGDHVDYLSLPRFRLNDNKYKATTGAKELVSYVNSLAFYKNFNLFELIDKPYAVGREDGLVQVCVYRYGVGDIYLPENQFDEILSKFGLLDFERGQQQIILSDKADLLTVTFYYQDTTNKSTMYMISPEWGISTGRLFADDGCTQCEVSGDTDKLVEYLNKLV